MLLAQLYTDTNDPNYIFNQARCFQQNSHPDEAISRFREYLRKARNLPAQEREEVQQYIGECEAMKTEALRGRAPAAPADGALEQVKVARADTARRMRTVGLVSAGVGALGLGFGIVMSLQVRAREDEFERKNLVTFNQKDYNSGQRIETLQWVGYAAGVVALGTGALFYFLGSQGDEPRAVSLAPVITRTGGGALLRVRM